jgi:transaldolase
MIATQLLHNLGQSLWLDNITRDLLNSGTLKRYIDELSVTGLTSNPTIFDHALKNSSAYDATIRKNLDDRKSGEKLFFEVALEDITRAADLFRSIYDLTDGDACEGQLDRRGGAKLGQAIRTKMKNEKRL